MQFQFPRRESEIGHTCCDLVADCCKHKAESNKELCSPRVKIFDDCRHVPLEGAPNDRVSGCHEDGGESAESSNDRQGEELLVALEAIGRETSEILDFISIKLE
jgi:hypothetical protein